MPASIASPRRSSTLLTVSVYHWSPVKAGVITSATVRRSPPRVAEETLTPPSKT